MDRTLWREPGPSSRTKHPVQVNYMYAEVQPHSPFVFHPVPTLIARESEFSRRIPTRLDELSPPDRGVVIYIVIIEFVLIPTIERG